MAASRHDIDRWIATAREEGAKYILSVCDTFDYDDYPVYCNNLKELKEAIPYYNGKDMQRVNEVIEIHDDKVIENQSPSKYI